MTVTDPTMTRFVMTTDRAVELAIRAADVARGGEVFVFKMPAARLADLVRAAIDVVAPATGRDPSTILTRAIEPRPGEKPYEELMTEDESTRAHDIGEMFAVLPSIEAAVEVVEAYRDALPAPVGAFRSDGVEPLDAAEVLDLVRRTYVGDAADLAGVGHG